MKKIITIIFMIVAFLMNIYLIFYWKPNENKFTNIKNDESISVMSNSKSIYTVSKENINDVLSQEEKNELKTIVNKLSTVDIGNLGHIVNLDYEINFEVENKELIQAFRIFKTRLSSEDYSKIRDIFSKFIDIEYIESNLIKI